MARAARKSISKGKRYAIFARDGFTCRYCGRQAGTVVLVVDHVVPVAHGGDNDPSNLITSCEDCNSGKGAKSPESAVPTIIDLDRVRRERVVLEWAAAEVAGARAAREGLIDATVNMLCEVTHAEAFDETTAKIIARYVEEFDAQTVREWVEKAMDRFNGYASDQKIGRYVSGIRRSVLEQGTYRKPVAVSGDPAHWRDFTSHA